MANTATNYYLSESANLGYLFNSERKYPKKKILLIIFVIIIFLTVCAIVLGLIPVYLSRL